MAGQTSEHEMAKIADSTVQASGKSADTTSALHQDAYHLDQMSSVVKSLNSEASRATEATNKSLPAMDLHDLSQYLVKGSTTSLEPPTDADRKDAQSKLDSHDAPVLSDEDKARNDRIHKELTTGDASALAKDLADLKQKHPADFDKYVQQLNKDLKDSNAGVSLVSSSDGKVLLYPDGGNTALQIDPSTGKLSEKPITTQADGRVVLQPGEVLNPDPTALMKQISDTAVTNIEGKGKTIEIPNWGGPDGPYIRETPRRPHLPDDRGWGGDVYYHNDDYLHNSQTAESGLLKN